MSDDELPSFRMESLSYVATESKLLVAINLVEFSLYGTYSNISLSGRFPDSACMTMHRQQKAKFPYRFPQCKELV